MVSDAQDGEIQTDLLEDFFQDFSDAHQNCENTLIDLEHDPTNKELLNSLFRSVHTIKGNLVYVGMRDLSPVIQSIEDVLDAVRHGRIQYDAYLSDVILLAMDKAHQWVHLRMNKQPPILSDQEMSHICQEISRLPEITPDQRTLLAHAIIGLMEPETLSNQETIRQIPASTHPAIPTNETELFLHFGLELSEDLAFFQTLSRPLELRSRYWDNRSMRQLRLGLAMNQYAGEPVDANQLAAAIYTHDLAMAFIPLDLLHKTTPLNNEELEHLQQHTIKAHALLSGMHHWDQASEIVLEHHERYDGSGYPNGKKSEAICPGAKILAIIDTFEARTHDRAYSTKMKRPFIRAILEINRCSGTHFDPNWVDVFNEVVRAMH